MHGIVGMAVSEPILASSEQQLNNSQAMATAQSRLMLDTNFRNESTGSCSADAAGGAEWVDKAWLSLHMRLVHGRSHI